MAAACAGEQTNTDGKDLKTVSIPETKSTQAKLVASDIKEGKVGRLQLCVPMMIPGNECQGNCDREQRMKKWCEQCFRSWKFSGERCTMLNNALNWTPNTLKLVTCYGQDCWFSIDNGGNVHCIDCFPDLEKLVYEGTYAQPTEFDAATEPPLLIWRCHGYKCRQETNFHETGIWCTSCNGQYSKSCAFMTLLKHRFAQDQYTPENVLDDIDFRNDST